MDLNWLPFLFEYCRAPLFLGIAAGWNRTDDSGDSAMGRG
jgi:hypothetical protein